MQKLPLVSWLVSTWERGREREAEKKSEASARLESAETKLPFTFAVQTLGLFHQHSALNTGTRAIHMRDKGNVHPNADALRARQVLQRRKCDREFNLRLYILFWEFSAHFIFDQKMNKAVGYFWEINVW